MRPDMNEVIIETARTSGSGAKGVRRHERDIDSLPFHTPIHPHVSGYGRKSQGDKLQPLRRFLRNRIGTKWDDVYSEICSVNDNRSVIGFHLRTHIKQMVKAPGFFRRYDYADFFVDDDGILRECPRRPRWQFPRNPIEKLRIDEFSYYKLEKNIWYRFDGSEFIEHIPAFVENGVVIVKARDTKKIVWTKCQVGKKELRVVRQSLKSIR